LFYDFLEFEDLLRSYPASNFANYHRDYAAKASIAGRIACERLAEQEKTTEELSKESRKLKHSFDLAQAANLDLEKKVAELAEALKRCQDEKKIAEDNKKIAEEGKKVADEALELSKKDLERLQKTHDNDL
jgi:predicted RNase H-like nuclease (RuvC/YqgF family)